MSRSTLSLRVQVMLHYAYRYMLANYSALLYIYTINVYTLIYDICNDACTCTCRYADLPIAVLITLDH